MIEISLLSPRIINFDTENGIICKFSHKIYTEKKYGIRIPVPYTVFIHSLENNSNGKFVIPMDGDIIFGKEVITRLTEIKKIIGQCSQIGEILNSKLREINDKLILDPDLGSIFEKYKDRYSKLDFMGHRNLLSDIIKSKKIEIINSISKDYSLKSVTKSFNDFIIDRNKYTHGDLMFWYPDKKTLLEYKNTDGLTVYGEVDKAILNSYLNCYKELDRFLEKLNRNLI